MLDRVQPRWFDMFCMPQYYNHTLVTDFTIYTKKAQKFTKKVFHIQKSTILYKILKLILHNPKINFFFIC